MTLLTTLSLISVIAATSIPFLRRAAAKRRRDEIAEVMRAVMDFQTRLAVLDNGLARPEARDVPAWVPLTIRPHAAAIESLALAKAEAQLAALIHSKAAVSEKVRVTEPTWRAALKGGQGLAFGGLLPPRTEKAYSVSWH